MICQLMEDLPEFRVMVVVSDIGGMTRMTNCRDMCSRQKFCETEICHESHVTKLCQKIGSVTRPGQASPGLAMSSPASRPGLATPGQAMSGQGLGEPGQAWPGLAKHCQARLGHSLPGQALPSVAMPGQAMPGSCWLATEMWSLSIMTRFEPVASTVLQIKSTIFRVQVLD